MGQSPSGLWYTCVYAKHANRSNVYVSGKKIFNKILSTPETMQGISISAESK